MDGISGSQTVYCFGCHVLDLGRAVLAGPGGGEIPLRPKAFDVLRHLVENAGRVVSRGELLDAVWPGLHINDDGVTQCIREVRRALGGDGQQIVRTIAKRGYLLNAHVMPPDPDGETAKASRAASGGLEAVEPAPRPVVARSTLPDLSIAHAPRLSLAVLPFSNLSSDPEQEHLADAVTDDLTTDLSRLDEAFVIGRGSAQTYRGRAADARRIGPELGVRYVVQGTVRRVDAAMVRINAELVSTETGAVLWTDRFDQDVQGLAEGQGDIVRRLGNALGIRLVDVEGERSLRERPDDPDAFDLLLRARSKRVFSLDQAREAEALLERALTLAPHSVAVMVNLAYCLMRQNDALGEWSAERTKRALTLLHTAEALRPDALEVIALRAAMLLWKNRYEEGSEVYQRVLALDPNYTHAYHQIGAAKLWTGDPEGALPFYKEALRRDPLGPGVSYRYAVIGYALMLARRPEEALPWLQKALHENPARREFSTRHLHAYLASALELTGDHERAGREAAEVARLAPAWTARTWDLRQWNRSALGEQLRYVSDGLSRAGLRDYVDEDQDSGVPDPGGLQGARSGPTPMLVPGAVTVRTEDVRRLLAEERPLVLDINTLGWSLPGAVVLRFNPFGGTLDDAVQGRLSRKMDTLTGNDRTRLIVVLGWHAEGWASRNVVLRLVAMGYGRVHWYRGGKEVWSARGLPTEEVKGESI